MSLTKKTFVDEITVSDVGFVFVRQTTIIEENDAEISRTFHRSSFYPGQDLTGQPANVLAIANAAWTPEIVSAYQEKIAQLA